MSKTSSPRRLLAIACLAAASVIPAMSALADTVYIKSGTDVNGFPTKDVTVTKIAKDASDTETLYYTAVSGGTRTRPLDQVVRIESDAEPALTQAEKDFVGGNMAAASENYRKAVATTKQDWVKRRAEIRLLSVSAKTGDFAGAVAGFVGMARSDPTTALQHKPALAGVKPAQLDGAIATVTQGLGNTKPATRQLLLPFLADLYNAKGDSANAARVLKDLDGMAKPATPAVGTGTDTVENSALAAAANQAKADITLTNATKAFSSGQFDQAIKEIQANSAVFGDPDRQAKALYLMAEAKAAQANTPDTLADAGLAYMRVVANFKALPGAPAADALYKTGAIEEKLQKPREALLIYKQVVNEFKDSKAAQDAQAAITRLEAAKG